MDLQIIHVGSLGTNCYLTWDKDKNCAVIDCGGDAKKVADYMDQHGLKPLNLLLTHGHGDHMGGAAELKELYPQMKIMMSRKDEVMLSDPEKSMANQVAPYWKPFKVDQYVKEGDKIQVGKMVFTVLETPGHTKGGLTFLKDNQLFCGDTLFQGSMGRTDLYGGNDEEMMASLRRLGSMEGYYIVLPGHGAASNMEDERRGNMYLRMAMKEKG